MQENKTIRKRISLRQRSLGVACTLAVAALTGCEEQPSPSTSTTQVGSDSAALYSVLSAALEQCEDTHEKCLEMAGESTRAQVQCEAEADTCRMNAQSMEAECESKLDQEAHHCNSVCSDEDAGTDDADGGSGDMNQCIARHAPKLPKCLSGLVACLGEAGICSHEVSRSEFRDCVHETHSCIKDEWQTLREKKHKWWHHPRAGSGAPMAAGSGGSVSVPVAGSGGPGTAGSGGGASTAGNGGGLDPAAAGSGGASTAGNGGGLDPASAGSGGDCDPGSGGAAAAGAGGSDAGRDRKHHDWFPWKKH